MQGKVLAVTERGGGAFKMGDSWLRLSFEAKRAGLAIPDKGESVEVQMNDKGYVNYIKVLDEAVNEPRDTHTAGQALAAQGITPAPSVKSAALRAAAEYFAGVQDDDSLEHTAEKITYMASLFESYLTGGLSGGSTTRANTNHVPGAKELAELPF